MSMFCFQCEQSGAPAGCTIQGVCGKTAPVANKQDELTAALVALAQAGMQTGETKEATKLLKQGLFMCVTNVNFDEARVQEFLHRVNAYTVSLGAEVPGIDWERLWVGNEDIISLRSTLLLGMRGMAAYAWHASVLGYDDAEVDSWFYKGLVEYAKDHSAEEWLDLLMEFGHINLQCMALLDAANTETYGTPEPTTVPLTIEPGPFIVVTGHDLHDLKMLLEQSAGKGVNIYTHGEMLPCHAYPELKKYTHLKGNFGTAWQNQQVEFNNVPAAFLFTTNCIMPPKGDYGDNIFTTDMVGFPNLKHIETNDDGTKDFTAVIEHALKVGGFSEAQELTGINGGHQVTTGFGHGTVLGIADTVIDAVKSGAIRHFFLVGGCDGAKVGRNYYTEFVKQTPKDTIVLTLACGKYRFNDLEIGDIGGIPRILDMGQCNDAYSAIQVAVALAGAFECDVNDLPLTLVLSWYEQKAVCILLTLLALGIRNIYIGPTLPKFFSSNVLNILVDKFQLHPITTPEADMKEILG